MILDALRYTVQKPDGLFWKETDYHQQKAIDRKSPVFKHNKSDFKYFTRKKMRKKGTCFLTKKSLL